MQRIVKSLALTIPLWFTLSCANECNSANDCAPGELCLREIQADGERGAAKCVAGEGSRLRCAIDSDCGDSGLVVCRAQRCVIATHPTTNGGVNPDASPADTGFNDDAAAMSNPDAMMSNPDAAPANPDAAPANPDAEPVIPDAGTATISDAGTSTTTDGG